MLRLDAAGSDLLPAEYLAELTKLQDRVPPFPTVEAFQILETELNRTLAECYARVDDVPVAAASLGQVYRGELPDGRQVAIKVQRPGAEPTIGNGTPPPGQMHPCHPAAAEFEQSNQS